MAARCRGCLADADAMYSLWILLREEDRLTARAWLRKAADAGNRDAMYALWTLHQGRDEREAERWLRRAANNGHRQALVDLSRLAAERGAEDDAVRWLAAPPRRATAAR